MEDAVSERRKAFAAAHRSDEDRQAYISASQRDLYVITKAKAEAWQSTCSSLSTKSNSNSLFPLLLALLPHLPSLLTFLTVPLPENWLLVFTACLRSHFSVFQTKALRSRARGYLPDLRRATYPEGPNLSCCSPFSPVEFLAAACNLSSSTATVPDKVAYPMLKHLPCPGIDFLLYIFNLSWTLHSLPSIWKTSSINPIHKMEKPLDSSVSFRPISLTLLIEGLGIKAF